MGVFCEIYLINASGKVYKPGQVVSGLMRYVFDVPTEVTKITTSLKGTGRIDLTEDYDDKDSCTYSTDEDYVDLETVIQDKPTVFLPGIYETKFDFRLPQSLPPSIYIEKIVDDDSYKVKCSVRYFIHVKFECPGLYTHNKHFRKEITIMAGVSVTLPMEPVIHGETKKLVRLFSSKASNINIKATILNSAVPIEGNINVNFEVENQSHVIIKSIDTKLIQGYRFKAKGHSLLKNEEYILPHTDVKTFSIQSGDTLNWSISINVPHYVFSIENPMLTLASRYYLVRLTARLPMPHTNVVMDIPVQIGVLEENPGPSGLGRTDESTNVGPPPSYWESMGESAKDTDNCNHDVSDMKKS